jgi:transcriptional regulator with XRE-family HTH domain
MPDKSISEEWRHRLRKQEGDETQRGALFNNGQEAEVNVGRALRRLREQQGLSIRALAEKSGLAVNTLSLIENNKTSPSVSTLQQLATALAAPITAFFETGLPPKNVIHLKASQRPRASFTHGALENLGVGLAGATLQPFWVILEPNADSGPQPMVHTGYEFVYCLAGRLVYTINDQPYLLEAGDSLLFESHLPHRWQNMDVGPSQALLVFCPLETHDRPPERHFMAT